MDVYSSPISFRPLRLLFAPVGVVAETRHGMGHGSLPRLAHGREERSRESEKSWAMSIQPSLFLAVVLFRPMGSGLRKGLGFAGFADV